MSAYLETAPTPKLDERTPLDWRNLLIGRLELQNKQVRMYERYYDGEHPLQFATSKFREAFGNLFSAFADNWCQIVVDAAVERLRVVGFQIGGAPSEEAWALWQDNALDIESMIAHTESGKSGCAYLLVDPADGEPRITVEHASQVIVAHDPGDRRRRLAALKRWLGDDGYLYATLYLPDVVLKFESKARLQGEGSYPVEWVGREEVMPNPLGVVPMIPLENKPGLLGGGHSDLEPAIPLQNAVNKLCSDMIVASEYGAFPQRAVTGVSLPKTTAEGGDVQLESTMSRLWSFKPGDAKLWDLKTADLQNFVNAIEMYIQHLAAQTRTPPHYLLAKLVNTSGDALSVAEAGLVSKCRSKQLAFSDPWEEAIALALGADRSDCEAIWASPERSSPAQLVDAAVKKATLSVPLPVIWLELGYTPEQIAEMEKLAADEKQAELAAKAKADAQFAAQQNAAPAPPPVPGQEPAPVPPPNPGGMNG